MSNKGGRPSKYKPEFVELAKNLSLLGMTDKELGDFFGVSEQTINTWKQKHLGNYNRIERAAEAVESAKKQYGFHSNHGLAA